MRVAVVIPTVGGREHHLVRCVKAYRETAPDAVELEIRVEENHRTCGRAWMTGASRLEREPDYLHFSADDLEPQPGWLAAAADAAERGVIPAPLVYNPDGTLQSAGISGWDVYTGPYEDGMQVASTTVPFIPWSLWPQIGMPDLHYASDMWVSYRARELEWPTVLCTGYRFTHHNAPRDDQHGRTVRDRHRFVELINE